MLSTETERRIDSTVSSLPVVGVSSMLALTILSRPGRNGTSLTHIRFLAFKQNKTKQKVRETLNYYKNPNLMTPLHTEDND